MGFTSATAAPCTAPDAALFGGQAVRRAVALLCHQPEEESLKIL